MEKKTIRLNEAKLRSIIVGQVRKALKESHNDFVDSGVFDYQGTGSPESRERTKQIRDKRKTLGPEYQSPARFHVPGKNWEKNKDRTPYDIARKKFGGLHAKSKGGALDELVRPLVDKISNLPEGSPQKRRLWDLYMEFFQTYLAWSEKNVGASNGPGPEGKLDEAHGNWFDNPANGRAYDRWKTSVPDEWDEPNYIDKDDFFDMIRTSDAKQQKEFIDYVKEYYSDEYEDGVSSMDEFLRQVADGENPFMAAIDLGVDWHDICRDFFDIPRPVDHYRD